MQEEHGREDESDAEPDWLEMLNNQKEWQRDEIEEQYLRQEWDKMAEYTNEVFPMDNKMLTLEEDAILNPDVDDEGN